MIFVFFKIFCKSSTVLTLSIFVVFSLVTASRGFLAVTVVKIAVKCGQMPKIRNYGYFLYSVYEFWQFYIWVFNLITRTVVNYRSSLQSFDLRFYRGDHVFDFFGNAHRVHREAYIWLERRYYSEVSKRSRSLKTKRRTPMVWASVRWNDNSRVDKCKRPK